MTQTIEIKNTKLIDEAQFKCREHILTPEDLTALATELESWLDNVLFKKDRKGLKVTVKVPCEFSKSSKYTPPKTTTVNLTRTSSSWRVESASRECASDDFYLRFPNLETKKDELAKFATSWAYIKKA